MVAKSSFTKGSVVLGLVLMLLASAFMMPASGDLLQKVVIGAGSASSNYGWNVSYAGDFNGDGHDDIIVGSPGSNKAHLFLWPVTMMNPANAAVNFTGPTASNFGWDVAGCDNVNKDSFDDIIIGAPGADKAYIFFGNPLLKGDVSYTMANVNLTGLGGTNFGFSVCGVGDFTADTNYDVFVGAPNADSISPVAAKAGVVYLFNDVASRNAWTVGDASFGPALNLTGINVNQFFGFSISYAGNFDGDSSSLGDIVIGAPGNASNTGSAYVQFGKPLTTLPPTATCDMLDCKFYGDSNNYNKGKFGHTVSNASNFGGDPKSDVIIGAPAAGTGAAYVFFGSAARTVDLSSVQADWTINGAIPGDRFGYSDTWLGDMNGDSKDDIAIGAKGAGQNGTVYVFYGPPSGTSTSATSASLYVKGEAALDNFGWSITGGGACTPAPKATLVVAAKAGGTGKGYVYFVNKAPMLTGASFSPGTGNGSTDFTFHITYTDMENDAPAYVRLNVYNKSDGSSSIPGSPFDMTSVDTTYMDGADYAATTKLLNGQMYYKIEAKAISGDLNPVSTSPIVTGPWPDLIPPGKATLHNETFDGIQEGEIKIWWIFPGDDNFNTQKVKNATMRYRNETEGPLTEANFNSSTQVEQWKLSPAPPNGNTNMTGTVNKFIISASFGLNPGETYYFAFKSEDEEHNWAPMSNVLAVEAYQIKNTAPPDPINNVIATDVPDDSGGTVNLTWELSSALDLDYYDIYGAEHAFNDVSFMTPIEPTVRTLDGYIILTDLGAGNPLQNGKYYWFAITAVDVAGNVNKHVNCSNGVRPLDNFAELPPTVTGVTLADTPDDTGDSLTVTWDATDIADFDCYKIYITTAPITSIVGKKNETAIYNIETTTVDINTSGGLKLSFKTLYYVMVTIQTINEKENRNVTSENIAGPVYAMDNSDIVGPGTITGLQATDALGDKGGAISMVWNKYVGTKFGYYNIYVSTATITSVESKAPEFKLYTNEDRTIIKSIGGVKLTDGVDYYVAVTVSSYNGVETKTLLPGDNSIGPVISINNSDFIGPPAIDNFKLDSYTDNSLTFSWTPLSSDLLDFARYLVTFYPSTKKYDVETQEILEVTEAATTLSGLTKGTTYMVNITAYDDNNNHGPFSADIPATPGGENLAPVIKFVNWTPKEPTTKTSAIFFTCEATDDSTAVEDLSYEWDFDNDGTTDKFGVAVDFDKYTAAKTYKFTVKVSDGTLTTVYNGTITIKEPAVADDDDTSTLIIASVAIGAVLLIIIAVVVIIFIMMRKKKAKAEEGPQPLPMDGQPQALPPEGGPQPIPMDGQPQPIGPYPTAMQPGQAHKPTMQPVPGQAPPAAPQGAPQPMQQPNMAAPPAQQQPPMGQPQPMQQPNMQPPAQPGQVPQQPGQVPQQPGQVPQQQGNYGTRPQ